MEAWVPGELSNCLVARVRLAAPGVLLQFAFDQGCHIVHKNDLLRADVTRTNIQNAQ